MASMLDLTQNRYLSQWRADNAVMSKEQAWQKLERALISGAQKRDGSGDIKVILDSEKDMAWVSVGDAAFQRVTTVAVSKKDVDWLKQKIESYKWYK